MQAIYAGSFIYTVGYASGKCGYPQVRGEHFATNHANVTFALCNIASS